MSFIYLVDHQTKEIEMDQEQRDKLASKYVGLAKKAAQNQADRDNLIYFLVSVDGKEYLGYPEDERDDRVCVEFEKRVIVKASIR